MSSYNYSGYSSYNYYTEPSIASQLSEIEDLLERKPEDGDIGDTWAIIPKKWLNSWKKHVGYASPGEDRATVAKDGPSPGPIQTEKLCKESEFDATVFDLKKAVVDADKVVAVPKDAFLLFKSWYRLAIYSKPIWREIALAEGEKKVEMHPITFVMCKCGHDGEPRTTKTRLQVSKQLQVEDLLAKAIDAMTEKAANEASSAKCKVWFSNDSNIWTLLGTDTEAKAGVPSLVRELPKILSSPKVSLMVEEEDNGHWLRSEVNRVEVIESMKAKQAAVDAMAEAEWRAGLSAGDLCDHHDLAEEDGVQEDDFDAGRPARKPRWREARVLSVGADGETLAIAWRGVPGHKLDISRDSDCLAKPFANARDWRNQLRTKTKVEIHLDALALSDGKQPNEVAPIYKMGTMYLYYIPKHDEWWIGDWIRQRHGYLTHSMRTAHDTPHIDPLQIPSDGWTYFDRDKVDRSIYSKCDGWMNQNPRQPITIKEVTPGATSEDYPEEIEISGHTGFQSEKMGVWKRTHWIMAEVHRIDRAQGKVEVVLKQQHRSAYVEPKLTDMIKGIDLFGEQIVEPDTHLIRKKKQFLSKSTEKGALEDDGERGSVGLRNLGNTCYMNSMLQCLNAAEPLRRFLQDGERVKAETNTGNPLGTGGDISTAYSELVQEIWSGQYNTVAPANFKETIGNYANQFAGFNQQDSMELFNYLLDNLHEDLNRVKKKPPTEIVDDEGQPDPELADESWRRFKLRNDSVVVDTLMGQFRSHLTCPKCNGESRKFDQYSSVALPLPAATKKTLNVSVVTSDAKIYKVSVGVSKKGNTKDLAAAVVAASFGDSLTMANIFIVEILHGKVYKTLYSPRFKRKELPDLDRMYDNDIIVAYQVPDQELVATADSAASAADVDDDDDFYGRSRYNYVHHTGVVEGDGFKGSIFQVQTMRRNDAPRYSTDVFSPIGFPQLVACDSSMTLKEVHHRLWSCAKAGLDDCFDPVRHVYPHHHSDTFDPLLPPRLPATTEQVDVADDDQVKKNALNAEGATATDVDDSTSKSDPLDKAKPAYRVLLGGSHNVLRKGDYWNVKLPFMTLPYTDETLAELEKQYKAKLNFILSFDEESNVGDFLVEVKPATEPGEVGGDDGKLTVNKCLTAFAAGERLSAMDTWYCSRCKEHVEAFKKMDLWSVPEVLTLHLKRFQSDGGLYREKIETPVHFSERIDMSPHVIGPQKSEKLLYELISVSNHIGYGINGGHYTAYAKINGEWALYNDATVTPCKVSDTVTDEAYVMFYRRVRDEEAEDGGTASGGGAASGGATVDDVSAPSGADAVGTE